MCKSTVLPLCLRDKARQPNSVHLFPKRNPSHDSSCTFHVDTVRSSRSCQRSIITGVGSGKSKADLVGGSLLVGLGGSISLGLLGLVRDGVASGLDAVKGVSAMMVKLEVM